MEIWSFIEEETQDFQHYLNACTQTKLKKRTHIQTNPQTPIPKLRKPIPPHCLNSKQNSWKRKRKKEEKKTYTWWDAITHFHAEKWSPQLQASEDWASRQCPQTSWCLLLCSLLVCPQYKTPKRWCDPSLLWKNRLLKSLIDNYSVCAPLQQLWSLGYASHHPESQASLCWWRLEAQKPQWLLLYSQPHHHPSWCNPWWSACTSGGSQSFSQRARPLGLGHQSSVLWEKCRCLEMAQRCGSFGWWAQGLWILLLWGHGDGGGPWRDRGCVLHYWVWALFKKKKKKKNGTWIWMWIFFEGRFVDLYCGACGVVSRTCLPLGFPFYSQLVGANVCLFP